MSLARELGQLTLGELIAKLKSAASAGATHVQFDFCVTTPTGLASYRGYYEDLAIGWREDGEMPELAWLIAELEAAKGAFYEGYKGGAYRMNADTSMWVANRGRVGSTIVADVMVEGSNAIITTAYVGWP